MSVERAPTSDSNFPELAKGGKREECKHEDCNCQPGFKRVRKKEWRRLYEREDSTDDATQPVWIQNVNEDKQMRLKFQVASVKKPLIAVKRIVEKGSIVQFGEKDEDYFYTEQDNER